MNKSLVTNLVSVLIIGVGYILPPPVRDYVISVGLFATSGAITNWLAVYMLFERVPGLYGSGVIPCRFEEFKSGIRQLIMGQFFTTENLERFFTAGIPSLETESLLESIDFKAVWKGLVNAIMESSFGGMLGMFGGPKALDSLEAPVTKRLRSVVSNIVESEEFRNKLHSHFHPEVVVEKVEGVVNRRLDELTPKMVKEIVQEMIRQHLGWLVVWGGAFGGTIGLIAEIVR